MTFTNKSGNISQWTNDAGYLTSVSEASVTANQSALSITESQISDLGSYITASSTDTLTNKSGNISQWTNDANYVTVSSSNTLTNKSGNISQWTNDTGYTTNVDQNLFETISSDSGSASASTETDTLTIAGGKRIDTSISGKTVTISNPSTPLIKGSVGSPQNTDFTWDMEQYDLLDVVFNTALTVTFTNKYYGRFHAKVRNTSSETKRITVINPGEPNTTLDIPGLKTYIINFTTFPTGSVREQGEVVQP
jgi:hypothetical protein